MPSRNVSISLPEEMLKQANQLAAQEQRTLSELFREAFRVYKAQKMKREPNETSQGPTSSLKQQELTRIAQELRAELD